MTRTLILMAAAAGLVLPQAMRAQETAKAQEPAAGPTMVWKIKCTGISSIPFTADAAQSLPLKIVGTLNCGDQVSLLSDLEGYTAKVRTADGKVGYVASMNLGREMIMPPKPAAKPAPTPAPPRVMPVSAEIRNGVARWRAGAQGCAQTVKDGAVVESLTANGVTVQVSLRDTGAKLRAIVAVENVSPLYVYVNPVGITLETRGEHLKSLAYQSPEQLANEMAQQAAGSGAAPASVAYKGAEDSSLFPSANVPQRPVAEDGTPEPEPSQAVVNAARQLDAEALKKGVLKPDAKTSGAVWFERDDTPGQYAMRVPIDNQVFEFPLSIHPVQ